MESELLKLSMSQGLGYTLFVFLFIYVLKTTGDREKKSEIREVKYQTAIEQNQEIIKELATKLNIVEVVKKDVEDIKESLK